MIRIDTDDKTIHINRGDRGSFKVYVLDSKTRERYTFRAGSKVSFVVVENKGYTKHDVLRKEFYVPEDTEEVEITLVAEDTKIGNMIDKKVTFWYNVVVNDDLTIIGSDENGEKRLILYPEVGENNE